MDFERENTNVHHLDWGNGLKAKPSKGSEPYSEEVAEIKSRRGDLEHIRKQLGLSKKKIAEMLLVDPSAWTRWTTGVSRVPAHVYRSLDWYLSLLNLDPKLPEKNQFHEIQKDIEAQSFQFQNEIERLKNELQPETWKAEKTQLMAQLESAEKLSFAWKALLLATFLLALL